MRVERILLILSLGLLLILMSLSNQSKCPSPLAEAGQRTAVPSDPTATAMATPVVPTASPGQTTTSRLRTLVEAMKGAGTDKGPYGHRYYRYYRRWFAEFQQQPGLKLLEIGAQQGGSLLAWSRFFTDPELIMGLAYGDMTEGVEGRAKNMSKVTVHFGDQGKNETMQYLREAGPWDVIIDDGSHYPPHMIFVFFHLWTSVRAGGMYVIEDLETNYWRNGSRMYGYTMLGEGFFNGPNFSAVSKLQQFQHVLVRHQIGARELSIMDGDHDICSLEWGMNIVAIKKCSEDEKANNPPYRNNTAKGFYKPEILTKWIRQAKSTNPYV